LRTTSISHLENCHWRKFKLTRIDRLIEPSTKLDHYMLCVNYLCIIWRRNIAGVFISSILSPSNLNS
ncbi:hypothetical protein ANCDUO_26774, partial [Ancylostoma duodenale]